MSVRPAEWLQGPWSVDLHSVSIATYSTLALENISYPGWIISYVKEGEVSTGTGGEEHRLRSGDVMLHPPLLPFWERSSKKGTHYWMHATLHGSSRQIDPFRLLRVFPVVTVPDPAGFETVFHQLLRVWENKEQAYWDLKISSRVLQLAESILEGWERAGSPPRSEHYDSANDRFAGLIGQMSHRLREKLAREDLAALAGLSPNYLDRAFERRYGLTPMQMLRDLRLKRSRQLLERTDLTLDAIADECGLTDAPYLCRQFKRAFGAGGESLRDNERRGVNRTRSGVSASLRDRGSPNRMKEESGSSFGTRERSRDDDVGYGQERPHHGRDDEAIRRAGVYRVRAVVLG